MTSMKEIEAKLKHPARLTSLAFGVGALIGGAIVKNKALAGALVGAGLTASGITIASLFNPIHIEPVEDTDTLETRTQRDVAGKGIGQSGSGRYPIPRPEAPAEELAATSVDEYLTGKVDASQLRAYGTEDVETRHEREAGLIPGQTYGPEAGPEYQNAVMGRGTSVAEPRISPFPNVETRFQRSGGNVVGQSGSFMQGTEYGYARLGDRAPRPGTPEYPDIPKDVAPLSGVENFTKIRFGQNYPGQAFGFRV